MGRTPSTKAAAKVAVKKDKDNKPEGVKIEKSSGEIDKTQKMDKGDLKRMLSKLTYLKSQGQDAAHKAYKACNSQEAKRTWFWDVYMKDQSLSSLNQVKHQHATKKTDKSLK